MGMKLKSSKMDEDEERFERWRSRQQVPKVVIVEKRDAADGGVPNSPAICNTGPLYHIRIGDEASPSQVPGVARELYLIRMKDVTRISGNQDARLRDIHRQSGASIAIFTDLTLHYHHAHLELSACNEEHIKLAKQLIEKAIEEIYDGRYVPVLPLPLMLKPLSQETLVIPSHKAAFLLCKKDLIQIEAETSTWLELDGSKPSSDGTTNVIHIQISGSDRNIYLAKMMINRILSKWTWRCWKIWWTIWRWL